MTAHCRSNHTRIRNNHNNHNVIIIIRIGLLLFMKFINLPTLIMGVIVIFLFCAQMRTSSLADSLHCCCSCSASGGSSNHQSCGHYSHHTRPSFICWCSEKLPGPPGMKSGLERCEMRSLDERN